MLETAKRLSGKLTLKGDKSISHRALMFCACANGQSILTGLSNGQDVKSTQTCLEQLGTQFETIDDNTLKIIGGYQNFKVPAAGLTLDCGNSGTTTRLLMGLLGGLQLPVTLTGDESLQKRPMNRASDPLSEMGIGFKYLQIPNKLPVAIVPNDQVKSIHYSLPMPSAQVKSAVLLAGLSANTTETIEVIEPLASRDHTERMLTAMGCTVETLKTPNGQTITLKGRMKDIQPLSFHIPSDISSAAFMMVAAAILPDSELTLEGVSLNPTRTPIIDCLKQVGVEVEVEAFSDQCGEPYGNITLRSPKTLKGDIVLPPEIVPFLIDELPVLTVLAMFVDGTFKVTGAEELRFKECDRLQVMADVLTTLGFTPNVTQDGYTFTGSSQFVIPKSVETTLFNTFHDHRIVMSLEVLNLRSPFRLNIEGTEWVSISFPGFYSQLKQILIQA